MDEEMIKAIAAQLKQPNGEYGVQVGETMNEGNLQINLATIQMLGAVAHDHILEIGMGNGFFVKNICSIDPTISYTGCDFSELMVAESCKNNQEFIKNDQAQFHLANANELPYDDNTFSKIFTINTIYFWDDVAAVLNEIKRVLKDKGQFIIAIRPKSVMDNFPITKYGFNTFSKADLAAILNQNGLEIIALVEKEEEELEFFGEKLKNEFLIAKAVKL
jgi:ubiquinone/menaquinone biosynthesis C-methylase UbiE